MASINSSKGRECLRAAAISALEGAFWTAAAVGAWRCVEGAWPGRAMIGLACAWAASTASMTALALSRLGSFKTFMWAFGGGIALRALVLAALVIKVSDRSREQQSAVVIPYILGVMFLLLVEHRRIGKA